MRKNLSRTIGLALLVAGVAVLPARAAEMAKKAPAVAGLRGDVIAGLSEVEKKVTELEAAIPDAKWTWRPAEGVRSVSEVGMHIAGGNYMISGVLTGKAMGNDPEMQGMEKVTDRAKVMDSLKKSYDHARKIVGGMTDADLDKSFKMPWGQEMTGRQIALLLVNHSHEHLGQLIAYARMNGVVPPWTAREQEAMKKAQEKK